MDNDSRKFPLIQTRGLKKTYLVGDKILHAVNGVDLDVDQGESIAIMGASGSGKSTLMHLLGCLDRPSEGSFLLMGKSILEMDDNELAKMRAHHIGFVFQAFNLIPQLTVMENILLPFTYRHTPPDIDKKALDILHFIKLGHRVHHKANDLSGGEMQRVAIARALIIDPQLILADEPTGNLDVETGLSILNLLLDLTKRGVSLVMVTHDPDVAKYCQRTIRMKDGKRIDDNIASGKI
jgi:putative ABC transport system ATP-binding protein